MKQDELDFHEIASIMPLLAQEQFDELVASIRANGLREPITLYEAKILDGRNRWCACRKAGVEPRFVIYDGNRPVDFVIDKNLRRRHLNESQRAMIAARLATLKRGYNQYAPRTGLSMVEAAKTMSVAFSSAYDASFVLRRGTKEQVAAIEAGKARARPLADEIRAKEQNRDGADAKTWINVRNALLKVTSLPPPADVARVLRDYDSQGLIPARLPKALSYLSELSEAWGKLTK